GPGAQHYRSSARGCVQEKGRHLHQRYVALRVNASADVVVQAVVFDVAHDPDNLGSGARPRTSEPQALTDGISAGKQSSSHHFIDDHHWRMLLVIVLGNE